MTRDEAVAYLKEELGFRSSLTTTIQTRLEQAQRIMEQGRTLPKFLVAEDQSLTLVAGTPTIAIPADFLALHEDDRIHYTPENTDVPFFIPRKTFDNAAQAYSDEDDAGPQVYAIRKNTLHFFPTPDVNYTLTWSYYAKGSALNATDVSDNPWLVNSPMLLIAEAGLMMPASTRTDAINNSLARLKNEARTSLYGNIFQEEIEGGPLVMNGENY